MKSKEIYEDDELFSNISEEEIVPGTIFLFGFNKMKDSRNLHIAVCEGKTEDGEDWLLSHATKVEGGVVVWPLKKFTEYPQYQKIYAIKQYKGLMKEVNGDRLA